MSKNADRPRAYSWTCRPRDRIGASLGRQFNKWMAAMAEDGEEWNGWPYPTVEVVVVGWAVRDRSLLQWSDAEMPVYVGDINENAPSSTPG
jgi:hypothetical protein